MPYIGKVDVKASDIKRFDVTGSTSATHTLSWTAPSEQSLIITINGVKQQDSAYTISGSPTTITLASALVATDEMEVIGINDIGQTNTLAQDSIVTDMIRDDTVTTAKIADDQITSAKLDTNIAIDGTFDVGSYLSVDSSGRVTMPSQPCFHIRGGAGYSSTTILFDDEQVDNGNNYNATNGRFTSPKNGYYFISAGMLQDGSSNTNSPQITLNKNGSSYVASQGQYQSGANWGYASVQAVMYLASGDYASVTWNNALTYGLNYSHFAGHLIG